MFAFYSFILVIGLLNVECSKILEVFPVPSYSHSSLGLRLGKELAARGHEVTMISPHPMKTPIENLRHISIETMFEVFKDLGQRLFEFDQAAPVDTFHRFMTIAVQVTEYIFQHENVQKLLHSDEHFDLVIVDHFFSDAFVGIAHRFNAPVILLFTMTPDVIDNYVFDNPTRSAYIPNLLAGFSQQMTFWERAKNLFFNEIIDVIIHTSYLPKQREFFQKYVKTDLELDDVLNNVSLALANSHVSVNNPIPLLPNIIEIGGFHVEPPKNLSDDLQKFLDDAKEGVVLFSMGSHLQSSNMKPEVRAAILKSFGKITQKVLWKFEGELPESPANVKIMKWLPQQDILAHPNVHAFISHGGKLSAIEAVYHGVPMIGIPVFGDQYTNVAVAAQLGYAINIPFSELSEEKLTWALNEILHNPKYQENVKQRSRVMRDRPLSPLDTAIYWIEYVIRNRGAPHFRNSGLNLRWYQRKMYDLLIVLTVATITLFTVLYIITKKVLWAKVTLAKYKMQ